jgi:hypothetical protein
MATFNGWTIVVPPASPAAPATLEFILQDIVASVDNPFTGQSQFQDWQASYLEASVSMPPLTAKQAPAWIAFLMSLRGSLNVFQIGDPLRTSPQGSGLGSPAVNGANQTGYSLLTKGWTAGAAGVLLPGDWLQIGYRLYANLGIANADGGGDLTLSIWPQLRESPTDSTAITLNNTKGLFRLKANPRKYSQLVNRTYGLQFEIREAL